MMYNYYSYYEVLPPRHIKYPVDFGGKLKIRGVRYDDITKIIIKVQLF